MYDIRQSKNYAKYLKVTGWIVENNRGIYYFIKKIPIIGFVLKLQRPEFIDHQYLNKLSNRYGIFQIIIEPTHSSNYQPLLSKNYQLIKNPYLPSKTIQLDLTKTKENLLKSFKKDARLIIKKNTYISPKCFNLQKIKHFRKKWKKSVPFIRYVPSLYALKQMKIIFGNDSLFITDRNESAGAIFLKAGKTCYYWFAFTSKSGRKTQTQYQIVWSGIKWAKKRGCLVFDFEGIYDERFPNKSWLGFSHFKKSFGGYEVSYPGAFVRNNFLNLLKFSKCKNP